MWIALLSALSLTLVEPQGLGVTRISIDAGSRFLDAQSCERWLVVTEGQGTVSDGRTYNKITPDHAMWVPAGVTVRLVSSEQSPLSLLQMSGTCGRSGMLSVVRVSEQPLVALGDGDVGARLLHHVDAASSVAVLDVFAGGQVAVLASDDDDERIYDGENVQTLERGQTHRIAAGETTRFYWLAGPTLAERLRHSESSQLMEGFLGVESQGGMDAYTVKRSVEAQRRGLARCADDDSAGTIRMSFSITPEGRVEDPRVLRDETGRRALSACLERVLSEMTFDKRRVATRVAYPFVFGAR
jgi:hypothetical protein